MKKEITLQQIADEMHISVASVYNALSGMDGVSEANRKRIEARAEELGFDFSRSRRKTAGATIGAAAPKRYISIGKSFGWTLYEEIEKAASEAGGSAVLEIYEEGAGTNPPLPRIVTERKINGLLILGIPGERYLNRMEAAAGVPCIRINPESCVQTGENAERMAKEAVEALLKKIGRKRIVV
jgi:DNA-binding LacI/PurR family transcriptional regulator